MAYRLIVDSCCEPVSELTENVDFQRIPLTMTLGEDTFSDDENLDHAAFLAKMRTYAGRVMSACPSPQAYAEAYASGKTNYVVTISSQLSGSYSSAVTAKSLMEEESAGRVCVIDSKSASAGEILTALKVKELAESGRPPLAVLRETEKFVRDMKTFFVLENLDNLMKNGRMNKIVGRLATVMQIRPILGSDGDGNIAFFSKARGTDRAVLRLGDMIGEQGGDTHGRTMVITHCGSPEQADRLKRIAQERYHFARIIVGKTGGISSLYANVGGVIVAF